MNCSLQFYIEIRFIRLSYRFVRLFLILGEGTINANSGFLRRPKKELKLNKESSYDFKDLADLIYYITTRYLQVTCTNCEYIRDQMSPTEIIRQGSGVLRIFVFA